MSSICSQKFLCAESLSHNYTHPEPLHKDVAKHILPIYQDLTKKKLLERCIGGHTQNPNDSLTLRFGDLHRSIYTVAEKLLKLHHS